METRWPALLTLMLTVLLIAACGGPGTDSPPSVNILAPSDQHTVHLGDTLSVESRSRDNNGISQVALLINGVQVNLHNVPDGEKSFRVEQTWLPPVTGTYTVAVIAYDTKKQESEPATVTVNVLPALEPTQSPMATTLPSATPTLTPTAERGSIGPGACTYRAVFVSDVTIPDDTELTAGTEFLKTWRLRNNSTCDWDSGFQLVFAKGDQMGGAAAVDVPKTAAGSIAEVSVRLKAPQKAGIYRGFWRMRSPDGQEFGDEPYVQIVVLEAATATPSATPTLTPVPKPDLDITLVSGNLEMRIGETLHLRVTVRNRGARATNQTVTVLFTLPPDLALESTMPSLAAGGEEVASMSHTFEAPTALELLISGAPDAEILEEDESNNIERVPVVVNPPVLVTGTITATAGLSFDLDGGESDPEKLDIEWRTVEGTVRVGLLNGAAAARLGDEAENVSYALVDELPWEPIQLALDDLAEGTLFGFRTSDERVGYAHVDEVLDPGRTSARLTYLVWDWR